VTSKGTTNEVLAYVVPADGSVDPDAADFAEVEDSLPQAPRVATSTTTVATPDIFRAPRARRPFAFIVDPCGVMLRGSS
jgi:hypothetical protein